MFSKISYAKTTDNLNAQIKKLANAIKTADAIVIGAGTGLSASAGFTYSGERFRKYFADFGDKYGFHNMYSGGFYPYETPEEHWAYWSRYIYINRYMDAPEPVYQELLDIVKDKDYFVITSNVDHCFQKAGFDKKKLFYTQGDYGLLQCSVPCCNKTFDNEDIIRQMMEQQKDMRIPSALLPVCPHCGKPLTTNLRADDKFVQDDGWYMAAERYNNFLHTRENTRILYLELGVGSNTPAIIKYPFWNMTSRNKNATYACINYGEAICPKEISHQSICINSDIREIIKALEQAK